MLDLSVVLLFAKKFGPFESLRNDFLDYGVFAEVYGDENELLLRIETCERNAIVVASAEASYSSLTSLTSAEEQPKNLLGFCGPHEQFYARWASNCTGGVKFLSHNLKEVRRAVLWLLAGGDFDNVSGEAIPQSSMALGPKVTRLSCGSTPVPRCNKDRPPWSANLSGSEETYLDTTDALAKMVWSWHYAMFASRCNSNNNV